MAEREDSVGSPHSRSEWTEQKSYELKINGRELFILRDRENHSKSEQILGPPGQEQLYQHVHHRDTRRKARAWRNSVPTFPKLDEKH